MAAVAFIGLPTFAGVANEIIGPGDGHIRPIPGSRLEGSGRPAWEPIEAAPSTAVYANPDKLMGVSIFKAPDLMGVENSHGLDIKIPDSARVSFVPDKPLEPYSTIHAVGIEAKTPSANVILEGVISGINLDKGSITLASPTQGAAPRMFFVVDSTKILRNGQAAVLKNLKVGDACRAEVKPAAHGALVALTVQVPPPQGVTAGAGIISSIDYSALKFTWFFKGDGSVQPLGLTILADSNTIIRKDGIPAGFGDLKVGDLADFDPVSGTQIGPGSTVHAIGIEAKTPSTVPPPPATSPR